MSSRSKSGRPPSTSGKASKKAPRTRPKVPCECCRKMRKNGIVCAQPAELNGCLRCDQEVCKRCLSQGLCYMCRLKGSDNLNSEASLKNLKKGSLKVIMKKVGCKKEGQKHISEDQMVAEIVQRCKLNEELNGSNSSLRKDNARTSDATEKSTSGVETQIKETKNDEEQPVKKTSGNFPLLVNVKNEDEIKKLSIPQLRDLLKYYNKFDDGMIERREFVEAAINLWKKENNIPLDYVEDHRQPESNQQGPTIEINGVQEESNQSNPSAAGVHRKESFVLPPESPGSFHEFEKNILQNQHNSMNSNIPTEITLSELGKRKSAELLAGMLIEPEDVITSEQGPQEVTINEFEPPEVTINEQEPPEITIDEQEPPEFPPQTPQIMTEQQEPDEDPQVIITPKAIITELPQVVDDDDSSSDEKSDSSSSGSSDYDSSVEQQEEVVENDNLSEDVVHAANMNRRPKVILTELLARHSRELHQESNGNAYQNHQVQYNMEDFDTYANLESFRGKKSNDIHIEGHPAEDFIQMVDDSVEANDSFVYLTPSEETVVDSSFPQRPLSLPLKTTTKRVGFKQDPDHICDEDQVTEGACGISKHAVSSSSHDDLVDVKEATIPVTPEQLFDTLQEMEDSMAETMEFPDIEKAISKRLSGDKAMFNQDGIDLDDMHTPEEFLENIQGIKSNLESGKSANIGMDVEKLLEYGSSDEVFSGQDVASEDGHQKGTSGSSVHWKDVDAEIESKHKTKPLDLPLIGSAEDKPRAINQRPESWGISIDEILSEESIKKMSPHQMKLLLQKHGINWQVFQEDQNEMIQEVTKLWLATRHNRISMYEEAISEDESAEESEGNISINTEFEITSMQADPKIIDVVMKEELSKKEDGVELRHETDPSGEKPSTKNDELLDKTASTRLSRSKDRESSIQRSLNEAAVEQRIHTKSKIPVPATPIRQSSISAYLMYAKSEDEIELMEEFKLRAILRQANISRKDIWLREDLIEEVKKLWREEQIKNDHLSFGNRSSSTVSLREFGTLRTSSRKASTDSLLLDIEFDSIKSEKDLENLTSRNLQNLLEKSGVHIDGLILREHFLRKAIMHWRQLQGIPARKSQLPVRVSTVMEKPELLLLENIQSEKEIEKLPAKVIREILEKHGLQVKLSDLNPDLVLRLKVLWRTQKDEDVQAAKTQKSAAEERSNEETDQKTIGQEMNTNGQSDANLETGHQETTQEDGSPRNSQQGPPKPLRLNQIHSLEDITSPDSIRRMDVKQIKSILKKHSVSYADCQEKHEIVERLEVLWRDNRKHENSEIKDEDLCKICLSDRISCVLLECGHMATCTSCGNRIKECPICRNYVVKVVRLYKS